MIDIEKLNHDGANIAGVILEEVVVNCIDKIPDKLTRMAVQSKLTLFLMALEWDACKDTLSIDVFMGMVKQGVLNLTRMLDEKNNRNRSNLQRG